MNDDDLILASAYLDGELDDVARRRVESSSALVAEVDRLRQVRAVIAADAEADAPSISTREAQLAAALDTWDRLPAHERGVDGADGLLSTRTTVSLDERRRRRQRWNRLAVAAAAVAVIGGGVAVAVRSSDNSDESVTADVAPVDTEALSAEDQMSVDASKEFGTLDASAAESAEALPATAADRSESGGGADDQVGGAEAPPADVGLYVLATRDDLAVFAASALDAPSSDEGDATSESTTVSMDAAAAEAAPTIDSCGYDVIVGPALYQDQVVVVAIDTDRRQAIAYLSEGCEVVDRAPLPDS